MFFEQAREQAESAWNANKQDDSVRPHLTPLSLSN